MLAVLLSYRFWLWRVFVSVAGSMICIAVILVQCCYVLLHTVNLLIGGVYHGIECIRGLWLWTPALCRKGTDQLPDYCLCTTNTPLFGTNACLCTAPQNPEQRLHTHTCTHGISRRYYCCTNSFLFPTLTAPDSFYLYCHYMRYLYNTAV